MSLILSSNLGPLYSIPLVCIHSIISSFNYGPPILSSLPFHFLVLFDDLDTSFLAKNGGITVLAYKLITGLGNRAIKGGIRSKTLGDFGLGLSFTWVAG